MRSIIRFWALFLYLSSSACLHAAESSHPRNHLDDLARFYGPNIAGVYRTVNGMPGFDLNGTLPAITYRRDANLCNELFLRENPEMAEDCSKVRETVIFENRYRNRLRVQIEAGEINLIDFSIPFDDRNPLKNRNVILLDGSLVVHDSVLDRYSHNHAKIYYFPLSAPTVEFDGGGGLTVRFGEDFVKFDARNLRKTQCRGFEWNHGPAFYRNRTRCLPDIRYTGSQPHMATANWRYPPLDGLLALHDGSAQTGRVPASLLYQKLKDGRGKPLFKKTGLFAYLKNRYKDGTLKKHFGIEMHRYVENLLSRAQAAGGDSDEKTRPNPPVGSAAF